MQDEAGPTLQLVVSFLAGIVVLVLLVLVVSQPGLLNSAPSERAARVAVSPTPVDFPLPPLPASEVTTYYLVSSEVEAASLRTKAAKDEKMLRAAGQLVVNRVVALVAASPAAEVVYREELTSMAQRSLQAGYGVRYEIIDLRRN